jgi:hypothetical protein
MATITAAGNGVFATGGTWTGGVAPSTGDEADAGGYAISVEANVTVQAVTNVSAGGSFTLINGVTLTVTNAAGVLTGAVPCIVFALNTPNAATVAATNAAGEVLGGSSAGAYACHNSGTGTLHITAVTVKGGSNATGYGAYNGSTGTINVNAGISNAGTAPGVYNASTGAMVNNVRAAGAGNWSATATWIGAVVPIAAPGTTGVTVRNVYANNKTVTIDVGATCTKVSTFAENGAAGGGTFTHATTGVTLTANVSAGSSSCVTASGSSPTIVYIVGNVSGGTSGSLNHGVLHTGTCSVVITGSVTGGSTASTSHGIYSSAASSGAVTIVGVVSAAAGGYGAYATAGTLQITGNVLAVGAQTGCNSAGGATITITGNVTGSAGSTGYGVSLANLSTLTVTGTVTGGAGAVAHGVHAPGIATIGVTGNVVGGDGAGTYGLNNAGTGTTTIVGLAVGNAYGNGSTGISPNAGVFGSQTGTTTVTGIQYGSRGQTPTGGNVFLVADHSTAVFVHSSGGTTHTLSDPADVANTMPAVTDVRDGVNYNLGGLVGTCHVPAAASVAYGVDVDATMGTACLTPAAVWDRLVADITTANSIGKRLKDAATVGAVGDLLAAFEVP